MKEFGFCFRLSAPNVAHFEALQRSSFRRRMNVSVHNSLDPFTIMFHFGKIFGSKYPSSESLSSESHASESLSSEATAGTPSLSGKNSLRHVAIIMDGNGRWAQKKGLPRVAGHREGAAAAERIVTESVRIGLENLTLYCFSSENWKRPQMELDAIMHLLEHFMVSSRPSIMKNNVRLCVIGRRDGIPEKTLAKMDETVAMSAANSGLVLTLAVNYGGRLELVDAARKLAEQVVTGRLRPEEIDEKRLAAELYTAGQPDPDLLIRTAGELRLSNFLLWQLSYSELWVTDVCWPDFTEALFHQALDSFQGRTRRFGAVVR